MLTSKKIKLFEAQQKKDSQGNYYLAYVLDNPPVNTVKDVWQEAVKEYLRRQGIKDKDIPSVKKLMNVDWSELRRLYNRLAGQGKQRRDSKSRPAPEEPFRVKYYKGKKQLGRFKNKFGIGDDK